MHAKYLKTITMVTLNLNAYFKKIIKFWAKSNPN